LWDAGVEGFAVGDMDSFWHRRERRPLEDLEFPSLAVSDLPGYACAHALRHLLRGDLKASNIYEIAAFLENNAEAQHWATWRHLHDVPLRRVQAICVAIARCWFGCRVPAIVEEEMLRLPDPVRAWLAAYAHSPLANLFRPNKDELWLHLSLLDPGAARLRVLRRRLIPLRFPGHVDAVHLPYKNLGWRLRVRRARRYMLFISSRIWRHVRALAPTLRSGAAWAWGRAVR